MDIVQHFCTSEEFRAAQSDWLMWQLSHLDWAPLLITPLQTYLQFIEAQQATSKA